MEPETQFFDELYTRLKEGGEVRADDMELTHGHAVEIQSYIDDLVGLRIIDFVCTVGLLNKNHSESSLSLSSIL